eukprot:TRINITY_DN20612_c0_g2_i1.p1 TRINITY_DN20612_c0_g2~~TRINITY_DN20612_c0_g2_i1.p1  ORF type:complete len:519 (+),score=177.84 TRINITY_DN20612_c0_g2_i1:88-1557(+)
MADGGAGGAAGGWGAPVDAQQVHAQFPDPQQGGRAGAGRGSARRGTPTAADGAAAAAGHGVGGTSIPHALSFGTISGPLPRGTIPSLIKSQRDWFKHWDVDDNGAITRTELAVAVSQTFSGLGANAGQMVDVLWDLYGLQDSVSLEEFMKPDGLADSLVAQLQRRKGTVEERSQPPALREYSFVKQLGEGAQGQLFHVKSKDQADCVLKLSVLEQDGQQVSETDVLGQAILIQRLQHPHLICYGRCFIADEGDSLQGEPQEPPAKRRRKRLVIEMPLYRHGDLAGAIARARRCHARAARVWRVLHQIASALWYLHDPHTRQGGGGGPPVIHRDIKPENVLLDDPDAMKVVLTDFEASGELLGGKRKVQGGLGTAHYQAPEALYDEESTKASDIFSLGVLLVAIVGRDDPMLRLDRELCFLNAKEWTHAKLCAAVTALFAAEGCQSLVDICCRMLNHDTQQRPTAKQVAQESGEKLKEAGRDADGPVWVR